MKKFSAEGGDPNLRSLSPDIESVYYNSPTLIHPHLYKCTFAAATSHVPFGTDLRTFLDTPGTVWVNKIPSIAALCPVISRRWEDRLALMRRPSGFGKTTFLSTSEFLYDSFNERRAAHVFGHHPSSSLSPVRGDRLVLRVDLQAVFYDTGENMRRTVNEYMNMLYRSFFFQYAEELDLLDVDETANLVHPTSGRTFDELLLLLSRGHKLILLIDNFNWPLVNSTPENYIQISNFIWECIVDPFRSALDGGYVVGGAILGQPLEEEPIWVRSALLSQSLFDHIGCDISDEERVRGAFGFTFSEVQALAAEVLGKSAGTRFIDEMKDAPKYCSDDYVEYSMGHILERLGQKRPQYNWVACGENGVRGRLVPPEEIFRS